MTKSELIKQLSSCNELTALNAHEIEQAVHTLLEQLSQALAKGQRIEVRGFGSFSLHYRKARIGRNPKTGEAVQLGAKYSPHFKPGKELRERVNGE